MRTCSFLVIAALVVSLTGSVYADDLNPAPWRGQDGTTLTGYEFLTNLPTPAPDVEVNPYGGASLQVWPGTGQEWWEIWGGRDGVWPLSGTIEVGIDNRPEPLPYKDIWVQLTWAKQSIASAPIVWETISGIQGSVVQEIVLEQTNEPLPAGDVWMHTTYLIHLEPNPDYEIIKIDGTVMVDELIIDTICIPEPLTLSLLAIGGLAMLRRRK